MTCIKKHVELDTCQNVYIYVNMDTDYELDIDEIPEARNALVFFVVRMNGYLELPIGYFLIDSLSGKERSNLLKTAIDLIDETGTHLNSVTYECKCEYHYVHFS